MAKAQKRARKVAVAGFDSDDVLQRLSRIDILRALPPEEVQELVTHVEKIDATVSWRRETRVTPST